MQILLSHGGRLGRFSLSQLLLAVITGIGLFSVAKVATDTMLMYAMPKREAYKLFVRDVTPCADTYAPEAPYGTYGLRAPASCAPYVPEAQGSLPGAPRTVGALYAYQPRACLSHRVPRGAPQVTPDFSPSTDEERAVLAEVLRAKRGERLLLQGRQLNTVSDGLGAPMLEPLSATTPTVQNAASGDV